MNFPSQNTPKSMSVSAGASSQTPHGELTALPRPSIAGFKGPLRGKRAVEGGEV